MIKKNLKITEKLPIIRCGTISNIFWTNGSYERPSNPISLDEIRENFIQFKAKVNWSSQRTTGTIKLKGDFNYLVVDDGAFYFLEKLRVVDVKRNIFVYGCEMDITMTMLYNPKWTVTGTLVKTLDEEVIKNQLDFTKPLVEDFDESITLPLTDKDKLVLQYDECKEINLDNFSKARVFSTKKLAWILAHLTDSSVDSTFKTFIDSEESPIRLFFTCQFDELLPQKYILKHINKWLLEGELNVGLVDQDKLNTAHPKLKQILSLHPKLYVLSKASSVLSEVQKRNIIEFTALEKEAKKVTEDYFVDVNYIVPINLDTGGIYHYNNRHIFDMLEDSTFSDTVTNFSSHYQLLPRAYTNIKNFDNHNLGVISSPLVYNISSDELDKVGHLTDDKTLSKAGVSIVNNISVSYYPDYWQNKSWTIDILRRIQDSVLNKNPVVGFVLFEIYDYWKYTRGSDVTRRYFNICTGEKISEIEVVIGIRFYHKDDKNGEIDLLVSANEKEFNTFDKAEQNKINFGLVTSQQCKLLDNAFNVFIIHTFFNPLISLNTELAKNFSCSFIATFEETTALVNYKKTFDLSVAPISSEESDVLSVNNMELMEHCYSNYSKIRDISTIRKSVNLPVQLVKGDCFWSNVSWVFYNTLNKKELVLTTPVFCMMLAPERDLLGKYNIRFSKIYPYDVLPLLSSDDNIISYADDKQLNVSSKLYPWVYYEQEYKNFKSILEERKELTAEADEYRKTELKKLVNEFSELIASERVKGGRGLLWVWGRYLNKISYCKEYYGDYFGTIDDFVKYIHDYINSNYKKGGLVFDYYIQNIADIDYFTENVSFTSSLTSVVLPGVDIHRYYPLPIPAIYRGSRYGSGYSNTYYDYTPGWIGLHFKKHFNYIGVSNDIASVWLIIDPKSGWLNFFHSFVSKLNEFKEKVNAINLEYEKKVSVIKELSKTDFYNNFSLLFSPSVNVENDYTKIFDNLGYNYRFKDSNNVNLYGSLDRTLSHIYENTDCILLNKKVDTLDYYWTDIREDDLSKKDSNTGIYKTWAFKISVKSSAKGEIVKGYALFKWDEELNKPIIQIILTDYANIKNKKVDILTPPIKSVTNSNVFQCINQKNFFYAWGQKVPIKAKLFKPSVIESFHIHTENLTVENSGIQRYRLKIITPVEVIDTKLTVPERRVSTGQPNENYIDLERLKIEIEERQNKKFLEISARDEKERLLKQQLSNSREELDFQHQIGPLTVATGTFSSLARYDRIQAMDKSAGALLAVAGFLNTIHGIASYGHGMDIGVRDLEQMDMANSFTIAQEKNLLDSSHLFAERREKLKLLELTSSYTEWNASDIEEIKAYNKLLFEDEEINFGFIHHRPKIGGKLFENIMSYYRRYGVDIFVNNFTLKVSDFFDNVLSIYKFDSIEFINIPDFSIREKITKIFINGVKFIKTKYSFEDPKLTIDESVQIKQTFEEKKRIEEIKRELIAKGEVNEELAEEIRELKQQLDECACPKEITDQLEKYKDSASLLSEQKMALEEEKTALTNQLTLEKRKVESANQQVINAGAKNLDLVRKLAAANAGKKTAENARDLAIREHQECEANIELIRVQLEDEKSEHEKCKKEKVVCVDMSEDDVFNDYVDRIDSLVQTMTSIWKKVFNQYTKTGADNYTYIQFKSIDVDRGYYYAPSINIVTSNSSIYVNKKDGSELYSLDSSKVTTWHILKNCIVLYNDNTINGERGYRYDNTVYHPVFCLIRHLGLITTSSYIGFYVRQVRLLLEPSFVSASSYEERFDTNFLSSTVGNFLCSYAGNFLGVHREYIKICKQFNQWNKKTNYLVKKKIPVVTSGSWNDIKTASGQVKFNKLVYFNTTHISSS